MSTSSDDIPLAQIKGRQAATTLRKEAQPNGAKPSSSHDASSAVPSIGAARNTSAAVPAEGKQASTTNTDAKYSAVEAEGNASKPQGKKLAKGRGKSAAAVKAGAGAAADPDTKLRPSKAVSEKQDGVAASIKAPARPAKNEGGAKPDKVKREKPTYDTPGQTQPTPDTGEPLAKFYLSLLKQRPESQIAPKWCVQRGLLPREDAEAWLRKNGKSVGIAAKKDVDASPARPGKRPAPSKSAASAKSDKQAPAKRSSSASRVRASKGKKRTAAFADDDSDHSEDDGSENDDAQPAPKKARAAATKPSRTSISKPKSVAKPSKPAPKLQQANDNDRHNSGDDSDDASGYDIHDNKVEPAAVSAD